MISDGEDRMKVILQIVFAIFLGLGTFLAAITKKEKLQLSAQVALEKSTIGAVRKGIVIMHSKFVSSGKSNFLIKTKMDKNKTTAVLAEDENKSGYPLGLSITNAIKQTNVLSKKEQFYHLGVLAPFLSQLNIRQQFATSNLENQKMTIIGPATSRSAVVALSLQKNNQACLQFWEYDNQKGSIILKAGCDQIL